METAEKHRKRMLEDIPNCPKWGQFIENVNYPAKWEQVHALLKSAKFHHFGWETVITDKSNTPELLQLINEHKLKATDEREPTTFPHDMYAEIKRHERFHALLGHMARVQQENGTLRFSDVEEHLKYPRITYFGWKTCIQGRQGEFLNFIRHEVAKRNKPKAINLVGRHFTCAKNKGHVTALIGGQYKVHWEKNTGTKSWYKDEFEGRFKKGSPGQFTLTPLKAEIEDNGSDLLHREFKRGGTCRYTFILYEPSYKGEPCMKITWGPGDSCSETTPLSRIRKYLTEGKWTLCSNPSATQAKAKAVRLANVGIDSAKLRNYAKIIAEHDHMPKFHEALVYLEPNDIKKFLKYLKMQDVSTGLLTHERATVYKSLRSVAEIVNLLIGKMKPKHDPDPTDRKSMWDTWDPEKLKAFMEPVNNQPLLPYQEQMLGAWGNCPRQRESRMFRTRDMGKRFYHKHTMAELQTNPNVSKEFLRKMEVEFAKRIDDDCVDAIRYGTMMHKVIIDDLNPENLNPTEIIGNTMQATAPELNDEAFESVDFIFGQEADRMSEAQLFEAVQKTQGKIKALKDLNITSDHVKEKVKRLETGLEKIVSTIDALTE